MLAGSNTFLEEAAETVFRLSEEEKIQMQCEAREDYYRQQRFIQKQLDKLKELESREQDMIANTAFLEERAAALQEDNAALQEDNAALKVEYETLLKCNEEKDAEIARLKLELSKKR